MALAGLLGGALAGRSSSGSTSIQIEADEFQKLLERAGRGEISTGRDVSLPPGVTLDEATLEKIGAALDRAEASGASLAAVLVDGRAFRVDVPGRTVLEEIDQGAALDVDRVVVAGSVSPTGSLAGEFDDASGLLARLRRA